VIPVATTGPKFPVSPTESLSILSTVTVPHDVAKLFGVMVVDVMERTERVA
jgi:hypothetical protein